MSRVFLVNPASANGATGRRWAELERRAAALGLEGDTQLSERPGHLSELAAEAVARGATSLVVVGGDGTVHEVVDGVVGAGLGDPSVFARALDELRATLLLAEPPADADR